VSLPSGADTMDVHPDTPCGLTDHGTVFEGVVNTLNGIVLHADQKARTQLRARSTSIEKGRRGVGEIAFGHKVVGLNNTLDVGSVDSYSNTHKHVLWSLGRDIVDLQQVGPFKGFETKAEQGSITELQAIGEKTHKL